MRHLVSAVSELRKSGVKKLVDARMNELTANFSSEAKVFSELCFCLLTANERAAKGMEIQEKIGNGFLKLPEGRLVAFLKSHGYRFYNVRARYIIGARRHYGKLRGALSLLKNDEERREWLVENVLGLGYKEASHLLRNLGFNHVAILDRHIIHIMHGHGMIGELPKTLNKKTYLENEKRLAPLCARLGIAQGELDFYLWYMETGKVLK
ncbi:N-glycosylase/DNA lyase [uncultured archaeon]|nr:N-glycosylase/DNA lyase [uncultured archaeon]